MSPVSSRRRSRRRHKAGHSRIKRWFNLLVVVAVLLVLAINRHGLARLYRLRTEQERLNGEIALLQEQTARLRQEMTSLQSDLTYIERLAREKYRMVKRGEKVFRVIPDQ